MATFGELQDRVATWLRDIPADTLAEIPRLINKAQREIQRTHNLRIMEAVAEMTTVYGFNALSLPQSPTPPVPLPGSIPGFKEPRARPYWTDADGAVTSLQYPPSLDFLRQRYDDFSRGSPAYVYWSGIDGSAASLFEVYPKADGRSKYEDGEYPISIPYWSYQAPLVNWTDTNWFTVSAEEYLFWRALADATLLNLQEERATVYMQAAAGEAAQVILADKKARVVQPQVMRYSVNAGVGRRWGR